MVLSPQQAQLFFKLWIPLLDFVNQEHEIDKSLYGMASPQGLPISAVRQIRDALWEKKEQLDSYIKLNKYKLSDSEQSIIASWKGAICDSFVVLRHLNSGSILLPMHNSSVAYIVRGIYSTWREMLENSPVPQIVTTTLIPFDGSIIYDGIIVSHRMSLVGNEKRSMEELYRRIKVAGGVLKSLEQCVYRRPSGLPTKGYY